MPFKSKIKRDINNYIRQKAIKYKCIQHLGGKCCQCGTDNIHVLSFHHKNPDKKEFKLSGKFSSKLSNIIKEIEKCELICHNCHRELHKKIKISNGTDARRKCKLIFLKYKGTECCGECGYNKYKGALEFHHCNDKDYSINSFTSFHITSLNTLNENIVITNELDKCEVLCTNCHILKHTNLKKYKKYENCILQYATYYKEKEEKLSTDKLIKLYKNNVSISQIAKISGLSRVTISDRLLRLNSKNIIKYTRPKRTYKCKDIDIIEFITNNGNINKFSKKFKMNKSSIYERIRIIEQKYNLIYKRKNYKKVSDSEIINEIKNNTTFNEILIKFNIKNCSLCERLKKLINKNIIRRVSYGKYEIV